MSKISLEGNASGTGTLTIAAPNTNSNYTLTLPTSTGTMVVTGGAQTVEFAAGTASAPSITFTGDTNTGEFSPAADTIAWTTGGSERMRVDSSGEILIGGTTSVDAKSGAIGVESTTGGYVNLIRNDTTVTSNEILGEVSFWGNDSTSNTRTKFAYIRGIASGIHAAGDNPTTLVFGCTNDNSATVDEFVRLGQGGTTSRDFRLMQPTLSDGSSVEIFAYAGTAGALNRSAGVGVYKHAGITNCCGYSNLMAEDSALNYLWADNSDVLRISTNVDNIGTTGGTVVGTQTSDERIKNIIGPVTYGLEQINAIEPIEFTLKDDVEQTKRIGFIAQQVQPIVPESVYDTKEIIEKGEPTKLGMEYVALIPVLVKAIQELNAKVEAQAAEIAALKVKE